MDVTSLARPAPPSTHSILTGAHLCDQVASLLLIEPKIARQAFSGEPVEEVLAMTEWALKHEAEAEAEAEFNTEKILPTWAQKRDPVVALGHSDRMESLSRSRSLPARSLCCCATPKLQASSSTRASYAIPPPSADILDPSSQTP